MFSLSDTYIHVQCIATKGLNDKIQSYKKDSHQNLFLSFRISQSQYTRFNP